MLEIIYKEGNKLLVKDNTRYGVKYFLLRYKIVPNSELSCGNCEALNGFSTCHLSGDDERRFICNTLDNNAVFDEFTPCVKPSLIIISKLRCQGL